MGRDSLNAVAWPAAVLVRRDPDAVIAQLTADQLIDPLGAFVTALEMSAEAHAAMVAAVAPYVDTAISKTVNVPEDYPYAEFQNLYLQAWKAGLKGLATYRPNAVTGAVLSVEAPAAADAAPDDDPLCRQFASRPAGELEGLTSKVEFWTEYERPLGHGFGIDLRGAGLIGASVAGMLPVWGYIGIVPLATGLIGFVVFFNVLPLALRGGLDALTSFVASLAAAACAGWLLHRWRRRRDRSAPRPPHPLP